MSQSTIVFVLLLNCLAVGINLSLLAFVPGMEGLEAFCIASGSIGAGLCIGLLKEN